MAIERIISKILSANDTGETGGHQAGILVPKREELISFFPKLDPDTYNPRALIKFEDEFGVYWDFSFIYYNNGLFGGTRNEYRLTRMTRYMREAGLVTGDEVDLSRTTDGDYLVAFRRKAQAKQDQRGILKLGSGWRVVEI